MKFTLHINFEAATEREAMVKLGGLADGLQADYDANVGEWDVSYAEDWAKILFVTSR